MAYNALNNLIDAYIYANGVQAITGQILNGVLKQMVSQLGSGYHLMGVAGPETVPASNDYAMAYFAATAGEYADFGGITLAAGEVAVLLTSGNGSWSKQTIYTVPTDTADLENTAGFITNAVTDLVNYYTKTEVDDTLANYPTLEALATALADYYTKTEIDGQMGDVDTALADRYTKSETDTKLGDYYKKTETYDKDEVDSIVAALSRQEYIVAWDGLAAPDVSAIPAGVTVTYSGTPYTGTLAASASTVNKIYMVWNGVAYDMYGTSQDGGYSWVPMGTTSVDLSQYATKAELSQLQQEVTADISQLEAKMIVSDILNLSFTAERGLRPSGSQGKIISGYSNDYSYYAPVTSGQVLNLRFSFSSGYLRYAFTQAVPAVGVACTGYASVGTSYIELNLTAPYSGYVLLDLDAEPTSLSGTSPIEGTIGRDVYDLNIASAAHDKALLANYTEPPVEQSGAGWVDKSTGELNTSTPYSYLYKKIEINSKYEYVVKSATISGVSAAVLNFYDVDDEYLGYAYSPGTSTSYTDIRVSIPANTAYIIVISEGVEPVVVYSNFSTPGEDYDSILLANYTEAPIENSGAGWVNKSTGELNTSVPYGYLYKKIIYDNKYQYVVKSATISGDAAAMLNYYDSSDNYLGYEYAPGTSTSYTNVKIVPPAGTKYIIVVSEDVEAVVIYSNFSQQGTYWTNKKILWLGTSIPATPYSSGLSYPAIVGQNLGALVTNNAISGSFARKKFNPSDIADMHDLDMQWDMLSMVTSFSDISDLQTNWATYKGCFSDAPDTLTTQYVNMYRNASYQTILDPFIQDADLIVFDHGRNDLPDMVNESDMFDKFTFVGAMNWLIKHIYEAKPRARICIISHYENQLYPTIVEAQEIVANYWSIPMFRLDKMLGWSNRQITTNHKWEGNVYVESETENTMSVQHAWLKDDLHPYLDSTGEATLLIANAITAWMKTVV